jgi:integrase/recombinase XerC
MSKTRNARQTQPDLAEAFDDFLLACKVRRLAPRTVEFYQRTAGAFVRSVGPLSPKDVKPSHVRAHLAEVEGRGVSAATVAMHSAGLQSLMTFLASEGYRPDRLKVPRPRVEVRLKRILSEAELRLLVRAGRKTREQALLLVLADSGIRRGEAVNLDWGDVDLEQGLLTIRTSKTGRPRMAVIGPAARRAVLAYRREVEHHEAAPLFQNRAGGRLGAQGVRSVVERTAKRAGLEGVTCHCLRRTAATLTLRRGWPLQLVSKLLGHTLTSTTLRHYAEVTGADLQRAGQELGFATG